jgi:DNA-binding GntR family transcriptional regulator
MLMKILTLTESIVEALRHRIISGELKPGQKLNEVTLTSDLDVSRVPLREAFRILEKEHLVAQVPRKGCFVTQVSLEDCREIFGIREMMECFAVDLLRSQNITNVPDMAAILARTAEDIRTPGEIGREAMRGRPNPYPLFHMRLIEATGNKWLISLYRSIGFTLARYQYMCFAAGIAKRSQEDHEQLLRVLETGAYDEAKSMLKSHIQCFLTAIEDHREIFFLDGGQQSGGFELAKPLNSSLEGLEKPWN